jgi:hypothetical protein
MSSQVPADTTPSEAPTHFTPRPKQDPPGMSALFVAVTVVCALGASSILITTRDGFGLAGVTNTLDAIFAGIRNDPVADDASDHTGSIRAVQLDPRPLRGNTQALAAAVHGSAQAASEELARVSDEISSLKSEFSTVKKDVSSVKSLVKLGLTEDHDDALHAAASLAIAPVKAQVDELAAGLAATNGEVAGLKTTSRILYSSIDQMTAAHINDIAKINSRIGKVEDVISLRADVTSAIPTRSIVPLPRKRTPRRVAWSAEEMAPGTYLVKGPTGTFQVTDGGFVPGFGRVETVRGEDGRLRLVTGKDATPITHR